MTATFIVWDEMNCEEVDSKAIKASTPHHAASLFAEDDADGNTDGIYSHGHVLCVRDESGKLTRCKVTVESEASYFAETAP